ncbi:MAG: glycosyltransferase family 39 protein, partial [Candidatus Hydrothermarchaeota archaeon]|nr:glycosyltransferase family 39 protein [Candidatus Hydrothermarchaeota archaeon]
LFIRLVFSLSFPLWAGPDEPAYYTNVQYYAENHWMPNYQLTGDINKSFLYVGVEQPPLYFFIAGLVYSLASYINEINIVVHSVRILSAIFGTAVIYVTYKIARELFEDSKIVFGAAMFVAFLPTNVVMGSVIHNETMVSLLSSLTIYFVISALKSNDGRTMLTAGIFFGLAILTKLTAFSLLVPCIVFLIFVKKNKISLRKSFGVIFLPVLISGWWFIRNYMIYGNLAPYIPALAYPKISDHSLQWIIHFLKYLFPSIWAQEYGGATLPSYRIIFFALFALFSLTSLIGFAQTIRRNAFITLLQKNSVLLLATFILANLGIVFYINYNFNFPEGRWMLASVSAIAIIFMLGQKEFWIKSANERYLRILLALPIISLLIMDFLIILYHNSVLTYVPWPVPQVIEGLTLAKPYVPWPPYN